MFRSLVFHHRVVIRLHSGRYARRVFSLLKSQRSHRVRHLCQVSQLEVKVIARAAMLLCAVAPLFGFGVIQAPPGNADGCVILGFPVPCPPLPPPPPPDAIYVCTPGPGLLGNVQCHWE